MKIRNSIVGFIAAVVLVLSSFANIAKAASSDPIRIPVLNWSSQVVMANAVSYTHLTLPTTPYV